mgnify:CR=1 FL=1
MGANNVDGFLNPPAARHHVFRDKESLARLYRKPAQGEFGVLFFDEDIALVQRAGELLPDHQAPHGGRDHGVRGKSASPQVVRQRTAQPLDDARPLADDRALKVLIAMQPGAQLEMSREQRLCIAEDLEDFVRFHALIFPRFVPPEANPL